MTRPDPPRADGAAAASLRRVFDDAGYTAAGIAERLGTGERVLASAPDRPVYLRRVGEGDALSALLRLYLLDVAVPRAHAEERLGAEPLGLLGTAGLLVEADGVLEGAVRIVPHEHLLIASDVYAGGHADHVAAVHGPSATLSHLTVRRPVARALDVGTGNGVQALLAASHAERVVATDVNERALAFAAFNAALNGVGNVELRRGSFFEPVEGERFELVVSNPPYVISPESSYLFRDAGLPRDTVSEQVVRALPAHLAEGGFATVMISWVHDERAEPTLRPAEWLAGAGVDALVLHSGSDEPLAIAAAWNQDARSDPDAYAAAIDRWVDYFREQGIASIAFGAVVLRRRARAPGNWVRGLSLPRRPLQPSGAQLERMFAAQDFLEGLASPEALLDARLAVAPDVRLEQELRLTGEGWLLEQSGLELQSGLRFAAGLDRLTTPLVYGLDGTRTLREALPGGGEELGEADVLPLARRMLEAGFLHLSED
jgi:hypothetical protein